MPQIQNFLARHLRSAKFGGHLGRTNVELARVAKKTGYSIHMVQSMALGRRTISDEAKEKLQAAISGRR